MQITQFDMLHHVQKVFSQVRWIKQKKINGLATRALLDTGSKGTEQISRHFNLPNHEGTQDMIIQLLAFIKQLSNSYNAQKARDKLELSWIHRLWTQSPNILD